MPCPCTWLKNKTPRSAHRSAWISCVLKGCVVEVGTSDEDHNVQVLHEDIQQLATAIALVYALEHGRHLARLDRLENLDDGLQVCVL